MANVAGVVRFSARWITALLVAVIAVTLLPAPADAAPRTPRFGFAIDDYAEYDGASKCDPDPEPGVVAFQRLVLAAYPGTGAGSISRACSGEASSEHNEGRAWDWGVNVSNRAQRQAADDLIDWLLAKDRFGHDDAMARRVGLMYMIWNRRIWFTGGGWSTYCVQRRNGTCVDPDDGGARHPHTDHIHFSFSHAAARKATTFFKPSRSYISAIESSPAGGYWLLGRNGAVYPQERANYYGGLAGRFPKKPYVAMASTASGGGYWVANANGNVVRFGDAPRRGDAGNRKVQIEDMATTPDGRGYWLLTRKGRVFDFGAARHFGDARDRDVKAAGLAATPTGKGYWIVTSRGRVLGYGDARAFGRPRGDIAPIAGMAATLTGRGYWIATETGRVFAFGDASFESGTAADLSSNVTGIAASVGDNGYRIVTQIGTVLRFGP